MGTSAADATNHVRVVVRVRPALAREVVDGGFHGCLACAPRGIEEAWTADSTPASRGGGGGGAVYITTTDRPLLVDEERDYNGADGVRRFHFDHVFGQESCTAAVYEACCTDLVRDVLDGVNATVFAYGQTGTGKTYTMTGTPDAPGVVALAAADLFGAASSFDQISVQVSYAQIYNTVISDLLKPPGPTASSRLVLREAASTGEVVVEGLSRVQVTNVADVLALVERGARHRKVISTALNSTSSRSHAVLTFYVRAKKTTAKAAALARVSSDGGGGRAGGGANTDSDAGAPGTSVFVETTTAKLHVVDLAGSERVKDSAVGGQNLRDACNINLSLFHLAVVVNALAENSSRGGDDGSSRGRGSGAAQGQPQQSRGGRNSTTSGRRGGGTRRGAEQARVYVPYKNDKLCFLLKDALGGNCRTALVATVSPAQLHARESLSTLQFAACCGRVQNRQATRQIVRRRPLAPRVPPRRKKPQPDPKPLPWAGVALGDPLRCPGGRTTLSCDTPRGTLSLSCLAFGDPTAPLVLCLHGYPSTAEGCYRQFLLPALVHAGFYAVALDMPGCGQSPCGPGGPLRTRSEFNLAPGGAADVVAAATTALLQRQRDQRQLDPGARQAEQGAGHSGGPQKGTAGGAVVVGYDWGGGVALSMATSKRHRRLLRGVVAFHPSYSDTAKGELARGVSAADTRGGLPVSVVWCEQDQFHSWRKWKPLAAQLQKALGSRRYAQCVFKERQWGVFGWSRHQDRVERHIVKFLTERDPCNGGGGGGGDTVHARPQAAARTTDGSAVTRRDNVVLRGRAEALRAEQPNVFTPAPTAEAKAVAAFRKAYRAGRLPELYSAFVGGGGPAKREAVTLFASLPELSPQTLQSPQALVELGLWEREPAGWRDVQETPRYFPGRRVLVRAPVQPCVNEAGFMRVDARPTSTGVGAAAAGASINTTAAAAAAAAGRPCYSTFNATVVAVDTGARRVKVAVECFFSSPPAPQQLEQLGNEEERPGGAGSGGPELMMEVQLDELLRLNHPHVLPHLPGQPHQVRLEDSLRCNYRSPLLRAKQCEIALSLWHNIVEPGHLDFALDGSAGRPAAAGPMAGPTAAALSAAQCRAVVVIRNCLDITSFQRGADGRLSSSGHERDRRRYCGDDVARFAVHGQGHCHTVSSVMAAFLSAWQRVLCIDLRYRGGHSFGSSDGGQVGGPKVYDTPEGHQWLEFSTRPSMDTYTCDLYCEDGRVGCLEELGRARSRVRGRRGGCGSGGGGGGGGAGKSAGDSAAASLERSLLCQPAAEAYQRRLYPNGKLQTLSGLDITLAKFSEGA